MSHSNPQMAAHSLPLVCAHLQFQLTAKRQTQQALGL